ILSDRNHVEVGAPLRAGDQVVVAGQTGLKDGTLVILPGDDSATDEEEKLTTEQGAAQIARADGTPS
ncbi:MAG: hypothetical protein O7F11_04000, partial [Acidobacteria bacterium]|nr:hypothetical protein [Acidobacteriota bacterium]